MHITVQAFHQLGYLADDLPADGSLELPPGATVADALACLGLDRNPPEGIIVFRNGRPAALHTQLEYGDRLTLMSPLAGG